MCVKVVGMSMDEEHMDETKLGRYGKTGYLYNIHFPTDPITSTEGTEALGAIHPLITLKELQKHN